MNLIGREELKSRIDRGDQFKLVFALGSWAFDALHIPGSLHYGSPEEALADLDPNDDIVVYCSGPSCVASLAGYRILEDAGFTRVRRYAGGLEDWQAAGYPLEGTMARA